MKKLTLILISLFVSLSWANESDNNHETGFCKLKKVKGYESLVSELERVGCKKGDSILFTRADGDEVARACDMNTVTYFVYGICTYVGYVRKDRL